MSSPTPVREKSWVRIMFWPSVILLGIPTLGFWALLHIAALEFACACTPMETEWHTSSRVMGTILLGAPLLFADWFVWWKWRDHRRTQNWAKKHTENNKPWYAKTGNDRPTGPIKNKPYEP